MRLAIVLALGCAPGVAHADGYCEHAKGVAAAQADVLVAPELFGALGYVDQPTTSDVPTATSNTLRVTAGVRYRLGGLWQGVLAKRHADADCKRHLAFDQATGATTYDALAARGKVLDGALDQASKILSQAEDDLAGRRATAQDVEATRLRVDELRDLDAQTHSELAALPPPTGGSTGGALAAYYDADAAVERVEGQERSAQAWDVDLRVGYDEYQDKSSSTPYFAVVEASFNLGWLFEGKHNREAAAGRRELVQHEQQQDLDASTTRLEEMLDAEREREAQTKVLSDDLGKQVKALQRLGGDDNRRYREVVWFDFVKVEAEHAYYAAHVSTLQQVLGAEASP